MKIVRTVSALGLAAAGMFLGSAPTSHAAVNAFAGSAQLPSEDTCFTNSNGKVTNTCTGTARWFCVAPYLSTTGSKSSLVTGLRPTGGTLLCHTVATTKEGNVSSQTGNISLPVFNTHTQWSLGSVTVPSQGAAYTCCQMSNGATVDTVHLQ